LVTTVATPAKWQRVRAAPSSGSDTPVTLTVVAKPGAYISPTFGSEQQVAPGPGQQLGVARLAARIGVEVLVAARTGWD
jgi:hypothetical protein